MSKNISLNIGGIRNGLNLVLAKIKPYRVMIALLVVAIIYASLLMRITALTSVEPSENDVAAQTNPRIGTQIDENAVNQLKKLRDNNVNVQSLFDRERQNPFLENELQ